MSVYLVALQKIGDWLQDGIRDSDQDAAHVSLLWSMRQAHLCSKNHGPGVKCLLPTPWLLIIPFEF